MKKLLRYLLEKIKLSWSKEKKPKINPPSNDELIARKAQKDKDDLQELLLWYAKTCPTLRLTTFEYNQIKRILGKQEEFLSSENLKKFPIGTLYRKTTPQVVIMVVDKKDVFVEQLKGRILSTPRRFNNYIVTLVEIIETKGPAINNLPADRLTQPEWDAIPSLKGKDDNFIDYTCRRAKVLPIYFRSKEDFLIRVTLDKKGKPVQQILLAEIVKIVKPFNP